MAVLLPMMLLLPAVKRGDVVAPDEPPGPADAVVPLELLAAPAGAGDDRLLLAPVRPDLGRGLAPAPGPESARHHRDLPNPRPAGNGRLGIFRFRPDRGRGARRFLARGARRGGRASANSS